MIGKCVISICKGMGMNVIVNTPHPHNIEGVEYVSLDELYRRSDIIQLHCPLTEENLHMINDEAIAGILRNRHLQKPDLCLNV